MQIEVNDNKRNANNLKHFLSILAIPFSKIVKSKNQKFKQLQNRIAELENQIEIYKQKEEILNEANRKLTENEAKYRMISDYSNDWEVFRDTNNAIIYCSPSIENLLGYTVEEYNTKVKFTDYVYPDDFSFALSEYQKLAKGEYPNPVKFRFIKKTGEIIWVETSGQPIFTSSGEYIGFRTSTRDISEHKKIEQALKESEEKYKNLFQFMDEGVLRTDNDGNIILANDAVAKMFGYDSLEDILGKCTTILYPVETRDKLAIELKKFHQVYNFEIHTRTIQGKDLYLLCNAKENINENAEVVGREGILRDITDLKIIEMELRNSEAKLKEANSTKDKFISILAHDLRSPFNSLIGFSELLIADIENYNNDEIKAIIENIYNVSIRTFNFLNELLEWARTQQNMVSFNPENIDLIQILNECIAITSNASNAKNIELEYEIPSDLSVFADINMLKTILRNLLSNAIKFTHKYGHIKVFACKKLSFIEITVSDNGIGMDSDTMQSLFKIGKTTSVNGTEGERGTGFGLLLCKEFVEKHAGRIWVESELGKGSNFKFTIPLNLN